MHQVVCREKKRELFAYVIK